MLGWEFPPFISGGLGTACYGLTKAMDQIGLNITFVLPKAVETKFTEHVKMLSPDSKKNITITKKIVDTMKNVKVRTITSLLEPYDSPQIYTQKLQEMLQNTRNENETHEVCRFVSNADYSGDMYTEVHRYASMACQLADDEDVDVVHAHDWMTFPAGVAVSHMKQRPLVVHVHSTEFDRSGKHVNQMIYDIERYGMHNADRVIAVSHLTRNTIIGHYGISGDKVEVVHNGIDRNDNSLPKDDDSLPSKEKIVLFLGRMTMQKGPEYFLRAAKKVLDVMDDVKFVMAGSGDMMQRTIEMAAELGIGSKVLFTGFLCGDKVSQIYQMADLFVMPSVSEPFGLVPLEALDHDVPVIISKQSGVAEVLTHALKVDFWDTDEIANKIVAVLKHAPLRLTLRDHGNFEVRRLRWVDSAAKCARIYEEMLVPV